MMARGDAKDIKVPGKAGKTPKQRVTRPTLSVDTLITAGFTQVGQWLINGSGICLDCEMPRTAAVYAFAVDGQVLYVGCASLNLHQRLDGYVRPGPTQSTNQRLNPLIRAVLDAGHAISVFAASPPLSEWNGLPVNQIIGLEAAIIRTFHLPWNTMGKAKGGAIFAAVPNR